MTQDTVDVELANSLAGARPVYDELTRLRARLDALRTVDDARLAYDALLQKESTAIAALRRDQEALLAEQRRRRVRVERPDSAPPPPRRMDRKPVSMSQTGEMRVEPAPRPQGADRRKLKKLVSRWQVAWSLDPAVIAQVNSIADDADRPLGEALALFEWRLYETPIPGETAQAHAARIAEWRDVLSTYADHLRADIATTETRYRNVLAIWERWSNARMSDDGRAEWERFINATRVQKSNEVTALTAEVAALRKALGT